MNLRLKLRKNQSTLPTEKLTEDLTSLEILGDSIQKIPSLAHLKECRFLFINAPEVTVLGELPPNLNILKLRGVRTLPNQIPPVTTLSLSHLGVSPFPMDISLPHSVETLDLNGNQLEALPSALLECRSLKRLNLDNNNLTELPKSFFELTQLNHLSLDNNPLTEDCKNTLFKSFGIWF
ncbi:MAG: hypothetical protein NXH75_11550 [Halobacteriovoraceae bacterium]|nr:hypothetical protein [Halobacteriovoraceae bacterium]